MSQPLRELGVRATRRLLAGSRPGTAARDERAADPGHDPGQLRMQGRDTTKRERGLTGKPERSSAVRKHLDWLTGSGNRGRGQGRVAGRVSRRAAVVLVAALVPAAAMW